MLIAANYRECVVFLSQKDSSGQHIPKGTAFIIGDPLKESGEPENVHLVTARHVVEAARATGAPLYVRGSSESGGIVTSEQLDFDSWHISDITDVAVYPDPPLDEFSGTCLPLKIFATSDYLQKHRVGLGDDVCFVGLFSEHAGSAHIEPIARFGNISMMPREPVEIESADGTRPKVMAYLVEARSWGGQSGSPAFIWLSPTRHPGFITMSSINEKGPLPLDVVPNLLGLVCGHFELKRDVAFRGDPTNLASIRMNSGIAIVIPAQSIALEIAAAVKRFPRKIISETKGQ